MIEDSIHYDTGSLTGMMHRDVDCPRLKGRIVYRRDDSDGLGFPQDQRWCATCSPADRARCDQARADAVG